MLSLEFKFWTKHDHSKWNNCMRQLSDMVRVQPLINRVFGATSFSRMVIVHSNNIVLGCWPENCRAIGMVGNRSTSTGVCYAHGLSDLPLASRRVTNPSASFIDCILDDQDELEDKQVWQFMTTGSSTSLPSCWCLVRHLPHSIGGRAPASVAAWWRRHPCSTYGTRSNS